MLRTKSYCKLLLIFTVVFATFVAVVEAEKCREEVNCKKKRSSKSPYQCYDDIDDPYVYFATKTAYRWNRNKDDDEISHKGCQAQLFWLLSRHGTRTPGTKDMIILKNELPIVRQAILKNHKEGRGQLCEDDLDNLSDWEFRANVSENKFLVKEGYKELKGIGERYQERFPKLLTRPFINESYTFRYTDSERTAASATEFAKGVFGKKDAPNVWYQTPITPDPLLRFYKTCPKWKQEVDDNPDAVQEKTLFEQSDEFLSMIQSVSDRLGFETSLSLDDIDRFYMMCSFEKAWRPKKLSPWCAVFSENDLEILEYREDLDYYYEDGYGYEINYKQACPIIKDIHDRFKGYIDNVASSPKGVFYFSHSGTLLKVLARFGLFKDATVPKHSNRHSSEMKNREWRTSLIDSFATNIALVLFKCNQDYYVTTYVQERPVMLPGCSDFLCPFSQFSDLYGPYASSCDLDQICRV